MVAYDAEDIHDIKFPEGMPLSDAHSLVSDGVRKKIIKDERIWSAADRNRRFTADIELNISCYHTTVTFHHQNWVTREQGEEITACVSLGRLPHVCLPPEERRDALLDFLERRWRYRMSVIKDSYQMSPCFAEDLPHLAAKKFCDPLLTDSFFRIR